MLKIIKYLLLLLTLFSASCLFDDEPVNRDEYEFAAGALNAYFIFRDSLPDDFMAFSTPQELYKSVTEPYTFYYDAVQTEEILNSITTNTAGIGIQYDSVETGYMIVDVVPNSPADIANLKKGDTIVAVDDISIVGVSLAKISAYFSGAVGDVKKITINRDSVDTPVVISVTLDEYLSRSVYLLKINDSIAYIYLSMFSTTTCLPGGSAEELSLAIDSSEWATWTIFDLRHNGGGELGQCQKITNEFIDSGISYMSVKERVYSESIEDYITEDIIWYSGSGGDAKTRKIYMLFDSYSASASEIVISALKANRTDILTIGDTTFGKARGQVFIKTLENCLSRVTCMTFTPISGENYDNVGIAPDILIPNADYAIDTAVARITGDTYIASRVSRKVSYAYPDRENMSRKIEPLLYKMKE